MNDISNLPKSQKRVLIILGKHEKEWLTVRQMVKESGVNTYHVKLAILKFMKNYMVFIGKRGYEETVTISPDGMSLCRKLL